MQIYPPLGIDTASYILYLLYHRIPVACSPIDERWFVLIEARCEKLTAGRDCSIHHDKPEVCVRSRVEECDPNLLAEEQDVVYTEVPAYLAYLKRERRSLFDRLRSSRRVVPEDWEAVK